MQVGDIADAAGQIQPRVVTRRCGMPLQQCQVRAGVGADAGQVHQDQVARMPRGIGGQAGWVTQAIGITIDRQQAVGWRRHWVAPALAADDRATADTCARRLDRRGAVESGIEPQGQCGMTSRDRDEQVAVVTTALDGVEVGDVQRGAAITVVQPCGQCQGVAVLAQPAVDRTVAVTSAAAGEHGMAGE